ncbi:MAG: glycosyltransferase family 4 protein [Aeromicrobium sp.]
MADRGVHQTGGLIQIHDFAGHPFQAELSRELARRELTVEHAYSAQYTSGKGRLERQPGDPDTLSFRAIETPRQFEKYAPIGRLQFERSFASTWIDQVTKLQPDLVIACNVPLFALYRFSRFARRTGLPYVLWHQDVFSLALAEELERRLPHVPRLPHPVVGAGSRFFTRLERGVVAGARRVVAIDDAFVREYEAWGLDTTHVEVVPNWAPVDEIVPEERDNAWADTHLGRRDCLRLLYAGTLGRKHNPLLLVELLERLRERGVDAELTVVSEGEGADLLAQAAAERPGIADFVRLLPFQPADQLSRVLGSGDVLVALLEPGASKFSIPSKVLSYLAAGRPVLGIMPADNPAAVDIESVGGCVVQPDHDAVADAVAWLESLAANPAQRNELGKRSRELAVRRFGIDTIAKRFMEIIGEATRRTT